MTAANSNFRAYQGIAKIIERLHPLTEHLLRYCPDRRSITLSRSDYDLIRRWPKAAALHNFITPPDGSLLWHDFVLVGEDQKIVADFTVKPDGGAPRYPDRAETQS